MIYTPEFLNSLRALRRGSPRAHNVGLGTDLPIERLRSVLEKYVAEMPPADRAKVIPRLQSSNDQHFESAKYEVLLYGFFRSRGWTVRLNAAVASGDADLLVGSDRSTFFVEVATIFPSGSEGERLNLIERIIAFLNDIDAPEFAGRILFTDQPLPLDLDVRTVRREVEALIADARAGGRAEPARLGFGWATVQIEPRTVETSGFIVEAGRPHQLAPLQTAQNALQHKVQHLGAARELGIPLVIALCDAGFTRNFHASVERILLGEASYVATRGLDGELGLEISRTGRAALFTTRAAHPALSAVLSVDSRLFDEGVCLGLELWHHPSAAHPLPHGSCGEIVEHVASCISEDVWEFSPPTQRETVVPVEVGGGCGSI